MPLPLPTPPALVQSDPEAALFSLYPMVEREDWLGLLDRSRAMLTWDNMGEGTRAKVRWMVLRALSGALNRNRMKPAQAEGILLGLEGKKVTFPLRDFGTLKDGEEVWAIEADSRSAVGRDYSGRTPHTEHHLTLDPKAGALPEGQALAEATLEDYQVRSALFGSHPRLTLRFREARFLRP